MNINDLFYKGLYQNRLPWHRAQLSTMRKFLDHYSLHDSTFVGLLTHAGEEVMGILWWYFGLIYGRLFYKERGVTTLLIRFGEIYQVIAEAATGDTYNGIADVESEEWNSETNRAVLKF